MRFEAHPRVSAGIKEEGCLLRGRVDVIIVGELRQGEECVPVVLSFSDKDPQVLFQLLVDPFCLWRSFLSPTYSSWSPPGVQWSQIF